MRAISLLNIMPIAVGLGACTNGAVPRGPRQAPEIRVDNPAAHVDDPPPWVRIRSIIHGGSGCPAGTVAGSLSPDFMELILQFDAFAAEIGPGVPLSRSRRICQILLDLDVPQGWSYSVVGVDYRGFANLEPGVSGVLQSAYYFQGEFQTARLQTMLTGPRVGSYQVRDSLGPNALVWSPCGAQRALIISASVWLMNTSGNPNARGVMTTDSTDGRARVVGRLQWRRCSP